MNITPKLLRQIAAGCVFAICLCFSQYFSAWIIFPAFSLMIALMFERHKIIKFITSKFFIWSITLLSPVIYFFNTVQTTEYFNTKYGIFAENLKYSIQLKAGIISIISIIALFCIVLMIYFTIQMWKTRRKPLSEWFAQFPELAIHSFSCAFVFAFVVSLSQIADAADTTILRLDAYQHSDCQTPENEVAIRKNDNICYSFSPTGIVNWELKEYPRNKH